MIWFKRMTYFLVLLLFHFASYAQRKINLNDVKFDISTYIFYGQPTLEKTDGEGRPLTADEFATVSAPLYSTFTIHKAVDNDETYIIKFKRWSTRHGVFESKQTHVSNLKKALIYNHVVPKETTSTFNAKSKGEKSDLVIGLEEEAYFEISKDDLLKYAYEYNPLKRLEFSYGTISYLARMRSKVGDIPGKWTTDLNLGVTAGVRLNFTKNVGLSLLGGLAISKINLDSISTKGLIKNTSEKPAFTPSLNLLFSYQNFSVGFGIGMDWINQDSPETKEWIYNNQIFYSIGFGINIFKTSDNESEQADQKR
jgi:hypothetical protein